MPKWDDDAIAEWPEEAYARAEVAIAGKIVRAASGTLTRKGRPPLGDMPKQQVTLRLPREVIDYFKAGGAGWQTRIGAVLEQHAKKDRRRSV